MVALIGGRGTGKTQIAVECIRKVARVLAKPCLYVRAAEIFFALRDCYRKDSTRREADVIDQYITPWLLVVDELHERSGSDSECRLLTLLLDKRYAGCKPTILIANDTPESFKANVGDSVWDRLHETGKVKVCNWASFRVKEGQ